MTNVYAELQRLISAMRAQDPVPWQPLLSAMLERYPCDAATLLVAEGNELSPVAIHGLPVDVLGRHFALDQHPRLAVIAEHPQVCRFSPHDPMPDPFDGLLGEVTSEAEEAGEQLVHDCIGVALRDNDHLIGMLTLDALTPGQFDSIDQQELLAMARLLGTCLRLAEQLSSTQARLNEALDTRPVLERTQALTGQSQAMRRLNEEIALVTSTDLNVLVTGETGVGKERVARQLHDRSRRRSGPLVKVNCAALSETLIESELFGHVKGAFSGAMRDRRGHFAMADGGTLFLDEIGEMPAALQPKLLRVLQEGEIQPLGSERVRQVDVRVVAATNRDLEHEVAEGRFRADLYHRLSAYPLRVPPLRERDNDVLLLAGTFLEENRVRLGLRGLRLSHEAEAVLRRYAWPGNVRELEHVLGRSALKARATSGDMTVIHAQHLDLPEQAASEMAPDMPPSPLMDVPRKLSLRDEVDAFQRHYISAALEASSGKWAEAARQLDLDPANLHRLATRLGLK
ncbi:nitric oxide reductase transcriptional regulator NorR [Phytohalomonas tamaricis]|uniref:nitric oxide reductase transcriptional regulator NorR n=1 Tax=Phytohalomonas tamaricis TaxID=2081032 RepID=UPI000D0B7AFA|nr:nitric oxide reductase transcriptional regulator NorR [Phytohalomonas tamaricis]